MRIICFIERIKTLSKKFYGLLAYHLDHKPNVFELIKYSCRMVHDNLHYHATFSDFFDLQFYKKTKAEKKEYWTSKDNRAFAELVDDIGELSNYMSKTEMYKELKSFVKRDQLYTAECTKGEFAEFAKKHEKFIYKPDREDCGHGIEMMCVNQETVDAVFEKVSASPAVLDELILQHAEMNRMCEKCVNTIRVFSLRIKDEITLIAAAFRMGNGTKVVDNYSAGGMVAAIDMETGQLIADAEDANSNVYEVHPYSQVRIKGFQIPNWEIVKSFVTDAAKKCRLNYVAWDIAVRQNDCVLVEANPSGMIHVIQTAGGGGRRKQYEILKKRFLEAMV